ncbi:pyrroloquinoline quinone biosynthesis protein PqqB [Lutibaculum baratangense]|uniref:pyrroloquinoline quinone biosynthesis protein PqqB n=1 Tax=Lutibaculum baratangense TaxID=1358440 RepID=UPI000590E652|nr:pyrroloquinoline quinone biosynthesis protein PqqB [Lutibaculum baratangense]
MRVIVLGSAAGGGSPQWNCRCPVCSLAWAGDPRVPRRTQSSLAVSVDGRTWAILNCSPDIREQIGATQALWPTGEARHTPIGSVVLTNADVDHVAGLLSLRERSGLTLWATATTARYLRQNPIFSVLADDVVEWRTIEPEAAFAPLEALSVVPFLAPGKVPLYAEAGEVETDRRTEATVGLEVRAGDKRLVYLPGCALVDEDVLERAEGADALLFDGTVFTDDEMMSAGVGRKTGRRMGHVPISGDGGSLEAFAGSGIGRRIYIHINNTNPILIEGSPERLTVEAAGWVVAEDGMEIVP